MEDENKRVLIKALKEKRKLFLTEKELEALGIGTAKAFRMQRYFGKGMPYVRVSERQIRYYWPDVVKHLKKNRVEPKN